ncbi:MAG: DNA (cytosine-5-)-methyltransferase [Chloroflexi bacterium]|nr:DNA (cytosine-5-)-methyltransferase [Chloroflexota bacterium]
MKPVFNHKPRKVGVDVQRRINALKIGQKMQDLPEELWHDSFRYYVKEDPDRKGGPNLRLIRLDPSKPSLTVTGYIFNKFVHPYEDRFVTPREAARLQGFPDELEFKGTLTSVQRQVGDAVPVQLGRAVFESLMEALVEAQPGKMQFSALSLFSGAGGFDIAADQVSHHSGAILHPFACVEIGKDRCDTLKGYFGNRAKIFQTNIRDIISEELLQTCGVAREQVDVVYGGPPCQSFSQAGKQKGTRDPRGDLIFEFIRIVSEICPPFFIMENVSNLKGIDSGRLLQQIAAEMELIGYSVQYRVLTATNYGSPQRRRRLIFVGTRHDIPVKAQLPEPTHGNVRSLFPLQPVTTVEEAFAGLPSPNYEPIKVPPGKVRS